MYLEKAVLSSVAKQKAKPAEKQTNKRLILAGLLQHRTEFPSHVLLNAEFLHLQEKKTPQPQLFLILHSESVLLRV